MLKPENLREFLVVLLQQMEGSKGLCGDQSTFGPSYVGTTLRKRTSRSELCWAAVANSPAARSCSSLAATGFDLRVSRTALRAWV